MGSDVIQSRADFFRVLDDTIAMVGKLLRQSPHLPPYESIELQLYAIKRWTANGRAPTQDERDSVTMGLLAVRELEPATSDEEDELITNLHELNYYVDYWPSDPDVAAETPPIHD